MLLTLQPLNGSKSNGEQSLLAKGVRLTAHLTLSHPPLTFPQSTRETIGTRKKEKRKSLYDDSKRSPCLSSKEDPPRSESREGATPQRRRCNLHSGELSTASLCPSLSLSLNLSLFSPRQCAWRSKSAREELFHLRVAWGAAIFLQCRWRIHLSKNELRKRRVQRIASIQIQRCLRGHLARRQVFQLMREHHPHTFMVLLKTVSLSQGGAGAKVTANVSMIASAYSLRSRGETSTVTQQKTGAKNAKRSNVVSGPRGSNEYVLRSWTESSQINDSSSPVWNQELTVTNATWNSQIALTLVEHGRFGKQSVIGQVSLSALLSLSVSLPLPLPLSVSLDLSPDGD
jgi:hypothetical protein